MSELVAHKVEVSAVDGRGGHQTDHLMERHTAFNNSVVVVLLHVPVHVRIYQPEDDGLISHQCLIVAFGVTDCLFVGTAVGRFPPDGRGMPVFIFLFLDRLDPVVGNIHCHAIVEAIAAVFIVGCQSGHAAHFLGDGDGVLVYLVDQFVGQGEISNRVAVLMSVEVVAVIAESLAQSVTVIEHGSDTVETETVELILFKPEFAVREQEMQHLVLAIIEAKRVPGGMLAACTAQEILIIGTVETSEALHFILNSMAVYNIHDDSDSHAVGVVYQLFQLFGRTETGRGGEEAADVITERAVVRMLLYRHDLYRVVSFAGNAG